MSQNLLVREFEYKETYLSDSFYSGCEQTTKLIAMRHAQCIPAALGGRDVLGLESVRYFLAISGGYKRHDCVRWCEMSQNGARREITDHRIGAQKLT